MNRVSLEFVWGGDLPGPAKVRIGGWLVRTLEFESSGVERDHDMMRFNCLTHEELVRNG